MTPLTWLVVAVVLDRAHLKLGAGSYQSRYNGYGCVDDVLARRALAPMAYRVLVPWLIGLAERAWPGLKPYRLTALYEPARIGLVAAALWVASLSLGDAGGLLLAALLPATFYFDYWDWAGELLGLALALTGLLPLALVGGLVAGLSKETALLVPVTYGLVSRDVVGAIGVGALTLGVLMAVRAWAGKKPLYCDRWMWRANLADVRGLLRNRPVYLSEIAMSLMVTGLTVAVVVTGRAGAAWPIPLAILAAGWTLARAAETRVLTAGLLWAVALFF